MNGKSFEDNTRNEGKVAQQHCSYYLKCESVQKACKRLSAESSGGVGLRAL